MGELEPAQRVGGHHAHLVLIQRGRFNARVGERPVGRHQRELGRHVGLQPHAARQVCLRVEAVDLTGQTDRIPAGVEPGDLGYAATAATRGIPVLPHAESVGRGDAQPGHVHRRVHDAPGRRSTIALWNPPKPLPTERTVSIRASRAVSGT